MNAHEKVGVLEPTVIRQAVEITDLRRRLGGAKAGRRQAEVRIHRLKAERPEGVTISGEVLEGVPKPLDAAKGGAFGPGVPVERNGGWIAVTLAKARDALGCGEGDDVLSAIQRLREEVDTACTMLGGEGPLVERLRDLINRHERERMALKEAKALYADLRDKFAAAIDHPGGASKARMRCALREHDAGVDDVMVDEEWYPLADGVAPDSWLHHRLRFLMREAVVVQVLRRGGLPGSRLSDATITGLDTRADGLLVPTFALVASPDTQAVECARGGQ